MGLFYTIIQFCSLISVLSLCPCLSLYVCVSFSAALGLSPSYSLWYIQGQGLALGRCRLTAPDRQSHGKKRASFCQCVHRKSQQRALIGPSRVTGPSPVGTRRDQAGQLPTTPARRMGAMISRPKKTRRQAITRRREEMVATSKQHAKPKNA